MKKWASLISASAVALSLFTAGTVANANTAITSKEDRQQIYVAIKDEQVTKEMLIKKLKSVLPEMFGSYSNSDFTMSTMSHHYSDDLTTRYELSFTKTVNKKTQSGSITFKEGDLEIESLSISPIITKDSLFPGKITEQEAQKIATDLVKKVTGNTNFITASKVPSYYSTRLITEPISYTYSFTKTENNIPIQDQGLYVSVLGDGTIQHFMQYSQTPKRLAFEETNNILAKSEAIAKMKDSLKLSLQYSYNYNLYNSKPTVSLVYAPKADYTGIHAKSGKWHTYTGEIEQFQAKALSQIVEKPLQAAKPITLEEAKQVVKKLAETKANGEEFEIDSAYEHESEGTSIISISYSYRTKNSSYGTSIEFNKNTGELLNYYDMSDSVPYIDAPEDKTPRLEEDKVLAIATDYVKQFAPASVHEYAKPIYKTDYNEENKMHTVSFPRMKNGIVVMGDSISVSINNKGELKSYYRNNLTIDEWPAIDSVISQEEAQKKFDAVLDAKLVYQPVYDKPGNYELLYIPTIGDDFVYQMNASTGEFMNLFGMEKKEQITHPTAEKELNYLIQAGAIEVKDAKTFNADKTISQGEALKTIIKSISYFYDDYWYNYGRNETNTIDFVSKDNPYYSTVESAYRMGIIRDEDKLAIDQKVTKEQLAVWFVRALGLEQAAKNSGLYKLDVKDLNEITAANIGYVSLSNALKLQPITENKFQPKKEISYAELAVSIIDLAYAIAEKQNTGY
ncbi:S-layer homology domain-containing protein [Solibacillus sp. MA9]|uniref:S-layer homology domain-containing protein n=1 Tax=Solibacillus palustris TaxID=2908203 RepID=A0ABS9UAQ6_9BACL|nr:YcdB/YcdC domain-containing protein [Solibacillus sp. MA9]MCH7321417.1 S-layer homology domain-containing protein [Solibacillus sp. MA9]